MDQTVRRIIWLQMIVTVLIAVSLLGFKGVSAAVSAVLGGAIGFLPSWLYAKTMLMVKGDEPRDLLKAHIRAEAYKLLATIVLFIAVFTLFTEVSALVLILAFAATLAVYWAGLLMIETRPKS